MYGRTTPDDEAIRRAMHRELARLEESVANDNRIGEGTEHAPSFSPLYDLRSGAVAQTPADPLELAAVLSDLEGHLAAAAASAMVGASLAEVSTTRDTLRAQALVLERFAETVRSLRLKAEEEP